MTNQTNNVRRVAGIVASEIQQTGQPSRLQEYSDALVGLVRQERTTTGTDWYLLDVVLGTDFRVFSVADGDLLRQRQHMDTADIIAALRRASQLFEGEEQPEASVSDGLNRIATIYRHAVGANPDLDTDAEVWGFLVESLEPEDLPASLDAFRKQLARCRRAGLLPPKQSPRHGGRATGKSVVRGAGT